MGTEPRTLIRRHEEPDPAVWQRSLESLARDVVETLAAREGENLVSAVLYGSVARGEAKPGSDVDLLLVFCDLPRGRRARFDVFASALAAYDARLLELSDRGIDLHWSTVIETMDEARHRSLYLDMTLDVVLLVDRGGFFAGVLAAAPSATNPQGHPRKSLEEALGRPMDPFGTGAPEDQERGARVLPCQRRRRR
jgi:predicted nucleotidyltransferase